MPAPLNVDREAVRTLVVAVGVREAARQMGLSSATVGAWSSRGKWTERTQAAKDRALASKPMQTIAYKPADSLVNVLMERKEQSSLHLSKYVVDAAKKASDSAGDLDLAQNVRHVAAVKSAVWPEQAETRTNVMVNLAILGAS